MTKSISIPDEVIINKIYYIRGEKIMLDRDLAELYGVETKYLKLQVNRNMERFPKDFMFELTNKEFSEWRKEFVSSQKDKMGLRYAPYAFTEDGVAQLSTVLKSPRAISVNLQIIRLFGRMRRMLLTHKDILLKLEVVEKQLTKHNKEIQYVFEVLKTLLQQPNEPRKQIGYKLPKKK